MYFSHHVSQYLIKKLHSNNLIFGRYFVVLLFAFTCLMMSQTSLAQGRFELVDDPNVSKIPSLEQLDFKALCQVARNTLKYINDYPHDVFALHHDNVLLPFSSTARVKATLKFICDVYQQDLVKAQTSRLATIHFLKAHFDFYRWYPDIKMAQAIAQKSTNTRKREMLNGIPDEQIFLTKYYTKLITGSDQQTAEYNQALYALPYDETGLSKEQAKLKKAQLTRFKYTRQEILTGVLTKNNLAKPLVWLTEEALHDVLLQGTGVLDVNGQIRYFNVHRNNGIAYDYALGKREQARYWYFAEVPGVMGYGETLNSKIAIEPYVSFAGNVQQLGLGQVFLVANEHAKQPFARLGVLADQGGAFDDNVFQLDYLVGNYRGWQDYHQANKHLPDYVNAWLLLVKQ